jgi:hypothetical protein
MGLVESGGHVDRGGTFPPAPATQLGPPAGAERRERHPFGNRLDRFEEVIDVEHLLEPRTMGIARRERVVISTWRIGGRGDEGHLAGG